MKSEPSSLDYIRNPLSVMLKKFQIRTVGRETEIEGIYDDL